MAEAETKHYITNGSEAAPAAREALEWAGQIQARWSTSSSATCSDAGST